MASPAVGPAPQSGGPPAPPRRLPIAALALVLAIAAVILAVWALVSAASKAPAVTLSGDAKTRVCAAFQPVQQAVLQQTNANLGSDPVQQAAVAANARLALLGGGDYLLRQIDSKTPGDLAAEVTGFANDLQTLGINYLAGLVATDPAQAELNKRAEAAMKTIAGMCS